ELRTAALAPVCLATLFAVAIFATAVMFDLLLLVFVLLALCVLSARAAGDVARWGALTLALVGALFAKGPIALVYVLPVAVAAPLWRPPDPSWRRWYAGLLLAVLAALAAVLAWLGLQGGDV